MKDRVPLYPGRVRLTPVSGQENTYDMVRADEPTQEGTPLNKATFLKDDTASVFGLGADAVPNDVLNVLTKSVLLRNITLNLPSSSNWQSVTYGNGKFVAVAFNSLKAAYSADGVTWTSANLPSFADWYSVTYGNGKFVAVAFNSLKAAYSADGVTWTSANLPYDNNWQSVTYGNGKFVAVADNSSKAAYSTDGVTWASATLPSSAGWRSVAYGNGKFVAVAYSSNTAAYSSDGVTWTSANLPYDNNWQSVTYGNGKFVAVADNSSKAAYSTDGVTWASATLPSSAGWRSVAYGNGKFAAVAYSSNTAAYSSDGVTWTSANLPTSSNWRSVTYGNGKFVAVASSTKTAAYSSDGVTWHDAVPALQNVSGDTITDDIASALGSTKIEAGSYYGTGLRGDANKNSITFDSTPTYVIIFDPNNGGFFQFMFGKNNSAVATYSESARAKQYLSYDGNTVYWYCNKVYSTSESTSSPEHQFNYSGRQYYYIYMEGPA